MREIEKETKRRNEERKTDEERKRNRGKIVFEAYSKSSIMWNVCSGHHPSPMADPIGGRLGIGTSPIGGDAESRLCQRGRWSMLQQQRWFFASTVVAVAVGAVVVAVLRAFLEISAAIATTTTSQTFIKTYFWD